MTFRSGSVIAVFERRPYWGPELQRQFLDTLVTICECRTVADLWPAAKTCATRLFVIDLCADLPGCLNWLGFRQQQPACDDPIIACGSTGQADLEWILREAGVTAFLPDVIPGEQFARLCRRQLGLAGRIS